jgi:ribosomal protein S18 acetylase RimI-like enzyme
VAEYKKKVIGFIAVKIDKEKQAARIVLIAVHKDFRGMGAANALVNRCLLLSAKLRNVYVKTQRENIAAISLYKKMGFKVFKHDRIFCKKIEG